MGIRFFCPNGHKLNVKSFLAGKRAYCPKCGTKLLVPDTSAASLAPPGGAAKNQAADLLPRASQHPQPRVEEGLHRESEDDVQVARQDEPSRLSAVETNPSDSPSSAAAQPSAGITSNEEFMWYVRPPSGGQYGPATRGEIDRWYDEGRIPTESLVWREGWADWRSASEALRNEQAGAGGSPNEHFVDLLPQEEDASSIPQSGDRWSYQSAKRKKKTTTVILLSIACLILMVIFLIVARPGSG